MKLTVTHKLNLLAVEGAIPDQLIVKAVPDQMPTHISFLLTSEFENLIKNGIDFLTNSLVNQVNFKIAQHNKLYQIVINQLDTSQYSVEFRPEINNKRFVHSTPTFNELLSITNEIFEIDFMYDPDQVTERINACVNRLSDLFGGCYLYVNLSKSDFWGMANNEKRTAIITRINRNNLNTGISDFQFEIEDSAGELPVRLSALYLKESGYKDRITVLVSDNSEITGIEFRTLLRVIVHGFHFAANRLNDLKQMPVELLKNMALDHKLGNQSLEIILSNWNKDNGGSGLILHDIEGNIIKCNDLIKDWTNYQCMSSNLFEVIEVNGNLQTIRKGIKSLEKLVFDCQLKSSGGRHTISFKVFSNPLDYDDASIYLSLFKPLYSGKEQLMLSIPGTHSYRDIITQLTYIALEFSVDPVTGLYELNWIDGALDQMPWDDPKDIIIMERFLEAIHPNDLEIIFTKDEKISQRKSYECFYRIKDRNGKYRWMKDFHWYLGENDESHPVFLGAVQDHTEKILNQEQLELFEAVISNSSNLVIILGKEGNVEYVNPAFGEETGYDQIATEGMVLGDIFELLNGELKLDFNELIENTTNVSSQKVRLKDKKNKEQFYYISITPMTNERNEMNKYIVIGQNITESTLLEKQLIDRNKVNLIGLVTSGIAHDFKNIIHVLGSIADLMLIKSKDRDPADKEYLLRLQDAIGRGNDLISTILDYGKPDGLSVIQKQPVHQIVIDSLKFVRSSISRNIKFNIDIEEDLLIYINKINLQQILINLIMNAVDAIGTKNGSINIIGKKLPVGEAKTSASEVQIIVSDTGAGISEKSIKEIFKPYYTSKNKDDKGEHYGLGLYIVKSLVADAGGKIEVESELGNGTTFFIRFPQ